MNVRFIEKPGVQDEAGVRHVAKRSSDPQVAYPEVKVQVRDLVRVVGIVAPFAQCGISIRGKFVLSSLRVQLGTGDICRVPTAGEPGKVQGRERVGIVEESCGYRARGVSIRRKLFYRETRDTRLGRSPCC